MVKNSTLILCISRWRKALLKLTLRRYETVCKQREHIARYRDNGVDVAHYSRGIRRLLEGYFSGDGRALLFCTDFENQTYNVRSFVPQRGEAPYPAEKN